MKVLVACEFSGIVRDAFLARGHNAWSCDLLPTEKEGPHIQGDVLEQLNKGWDLMIAHPPCTYLSNAGVVYLHSKPTNGGLPKVHGELRWEKMREAAIFFKRLLQVPIERIAVENPVMHHYGYEEIGVKYDQLIHPWQFGDEARKRTCLWLKNLPKLVPTKIVGKGELHITSGGKQVAKWYMNIKGHDRSRTFQGIAEAMASQWG